VKVFILNNEYMGMVRQWQELLHGSRYSESYSDALPDFVKLAEASTATGIRIEGQRRSWSPASARCSRIPGPVIVDCAVDELANCFPMIPSGAAHNEMILQTDQVSGRNGVTRRWGWSGLIAHTPQGTNGRPDRQRQRAARLP
jgi:acetolactate synthase-1/2/3 large subunit